MNLHGSHGRTNGAVGLQGHTAFGAGFHDGHGLAPVGVGLAGAVALQIEGAGIAQRQQAPPVTCTRMGSRTVGLSTPFWSV